MRETPTDRANQAWVMRRLQATLGCRIIPHSRGHIIDCHGIDPDTGQIWAWFEIKCRRGDPRKHILSVYKHEALTRHAAQYGGQPVYVWGLPEIGAVRWAHCANVDTAHPEDYLRPGRRADAVELVYMVPRECTHLLGGG